MPSIVNNDFWRDKLILSLSHAFIWRKKAAFTDEDRKISDKGFWPI